MAVKKSGPVVWEGWFSLSVPHAWHFEQLEGLITIEAIHGALHISCFERTADSPPSHDEVVGMASRFARGQDWQLREEDIRTTTLDGSPCSIFEAETDEDGTRMAWEVWHVVDETRSVLMTHVCPATKVDAESPAVRAMVDSFAWEPTDG